MTIEVIIFKDSIPREGDILTRLFPPWWSPHPFPKGVWVKWLLRTLQLSESIAHVLVQSHKCVDMYKCVRGRVDQKTHTHIHYSNKFKQEDIPLFPLSLNSLLLSPKFTYSSTVPWDSVAKSPNMIPLFVHLVSSQRQSVHTWNLRLCGQRDCALQQLAVDCGVLSAPSSMTKKGTQCNRPDLSHLQDSG